MFNNARISLTAWYLLIIMIISVMFSTIIYNVESNEIERFEQIQRLRIFRRLQERGIVIPNYQSPPPPFQIQYSNPELLEEQKQRLLLVLIIMNLGILCISGGLGYVLAGKTLQPIKEMMDEQNQFISDASHELKTPLTSLKSAFEVYLRDPSPSIHESKTIMKESIVEVNKLQTLTESLLNLALFKKPHNHSIHTIVATTEFITEAINKMKPIAKKRQINIEFIPIDYKIKGDKYILRDLIVIFLDNAIKYSPMKSKITIQVTKKMNHVLISITDQGIGILKKDLPYIFNRFYRADTARSKAVFEGYGLGLSIAKKIVENHFGYIQVSSIHGKGSTFTVVLPKM